MRTMRKILLLCVFLYVSLTTGGLFAIELFTDSKVFNDTIIGMIVGQSVGFIGSYVVFYTTPDDEEK